jgi:hypothetical protein
MCDCVCAAVYYVVVVCVRVHATNSSVVCSIVECAVYV